ncbi:hypothetical protein RB195_016156 [Necator americanus]|uniref:Uncharacterized protein n=1 Tax=Necator americanus TaxID=51031 RepID=A0ABR1E9P7_NECAM
MGHRAAAFTAQHLLKYFSLKSMGHAFASGRLALNHVLECIYTWVNQHHEARTVAEAAALGSGAVETAVGIEVGSWGTAEVCGGSVDPYAIPTATL